MLQEIFKFEQLGLPCGLTPVILDAICQEYAELTAELVDEDAYQQSLPVLYEFLKRYEFSQPMDYCFEKLKSMNSILTAALDRGESYSEYASQFLQNYYPSPVPLLMWRAWMTLRHSFWNNKSRALSSVIITVLCKKVA